MKRRKAEQRTLRLLRMTSTEMRARKPIVRAPIIALRAETLFEDRYVRGSISGLFGKPEQERLPFRTADEAVLRRSGDLLSLARSACVLQRLVRVREMPKT